MKRIANECFFAWVESEIKSGRSVKFRVKGNSMMPLLRNGKDEVVVGPYDKEELKLFDVILFRQTDRYVLHRIIQKRDSRYLMQGDGSSTLQRGCKVENKRCKVVLWNIERNNLNLRSPSPNPSPWARKNSLP